MVLILWLALGLSDILGNICEVDEEHQLNCGWDRKWNSGFYDRSEFVIHRFVT